MTKDSAEKLPAGFVWWWLIWAITFISSLLPPLAHHCCDLSAAIENARGGSRLLPGDLWLLRGFGQLSGGVPILSIGICIWAIREPNSRRGILAAGSCMTAVVSSAYAALCVLLLSGRIP